jgi:hypothetical protein
VLFVPLNATVAIFVALELELFVPLQLPQFTVKVLVVLGYVIVPLVGLTLTLHVPLFTVNSYVAVLAL